jgi:hypothetical protein
MPLEGCGAISGRSHAAALSQKAEAVSLALEKHATHAGAIPLSTQSAHRRIGYPDSGPATPSPPAMKQNGFIASLHPACATQQSARCETRINFHNRSN